MEMRKWWAIVAAVWMLAIFIATHLPYFTGKNTAEVIKKTVVHEQVNVTNPIVVKSKQESIDIARLNLLVRKTTHVLVFGILAFLLFKGLEAHRYSYLLAWSLTTLYAITDEWHQSFMPGRVAAFWDVLLDSSGASIVLLMVYFFYGKRKIVKE